MEDIESFEYLSKNKLYHSHISATLLTLFFQEFGVVFTNSQLIYKFYYNISLPLLGKHLSKLLVWGLIVYLKTMDTTCMCVLGGGVVGSGGEII